MFFISIFYLSLVIHILSAIAWLGSLITLEFILIPSFINNPTPINDQLLYNVNKKYISIAHIASVTILITGLYQTFNIGYLSFTKLFQTSYGNLILFKVLLYFIFVIIGLFSGLKLTNVESNISKEKLELLLKKTKDLLYLDSLIGLLIIIVAISLSINPQISLL